MNKDSGREILKLFAVRRRGALLAPALLLSGALSGCDFGPSLPDEEDEPYYRLTVEAVFDGEPVRIDGVIRCELSKMYRDGLDTAPPSVVAKLRPGLIGTRLKAGAPGALYIIAPRLCQHILKEGTLPTPVEGFIPLLAWFEDPGESYRLQLYLYDAYHPSAESQIEFESFTISDATHAEHKAWLEAYTTGLDALPLDPIADYELKYFAEETRTFGPGGGFGCDYGLRIPPEVWRKEPLIVEWIESQSGDGRYWAIPLPSVEERTEDKSNAYARTLVTHDIYFRDGEGKWLGQEPMGYQFGGMLHPETAIRYAYDKATLRRITVPITDDIWDFYLPYRYTADGAAFSSGTVGVVECHAGGFRQNGLQVRQKSRIEGLRNGDWRIAGDFFYDTLTGDFVTRGTTGLSYDTAY